MAAELPSPAALPLPPTLPTAASLLQRLGSGFSCAINAQAVPAPHWVARNREWADALGLAPTFFTDPAALSLLAGNTAHPPEYHASVYSGHQFGHWAGQLGDGRAVLLGQLQTPHGVHEVQLKGAGTTPYSRMGDGRAVLRSSIREYLASEAMQALGIPTTRALAIVGSPLPVLREQSEHAAILTRTAPSFIRFGHFEHFAAHGLHTGQWQPLQTLLDACIQNYYPECAAAPIPAAAFLGQVVLRSAKLVAQWQAVGFCHGVMNTDNMSILGLTLDYGPFQWMDGFDPEHICNHSDNQGRYRYSQQPAIMRWNLFCLGQALMPLLAHALGEEAASAALIDELERFSTHYSHAWQAEMAAKLGLPTLDAQSLPIVQRLLELLAAERVDWSIFWRRWALALNAWQDQGAQGAQGALADSAFVEAVRDLFVDRTGFSSWLLSFYELLRQDLQPELTKRRMKNMLTRNPAYVLRNHLAQEAILAAEQGDFAPCARLTDILRQPFQEQAGAVHYGDFPPTWAAGISVSCSS